MLFHGIYYTYTGCAGWANQASFPFRSGCYFRLLLLHHDQHHLHRGSIIQPSIEISAAAAAAATVRSGENFLRWFIIPAARWKLKISRSGIPRKDIWHSFTFVHSNAKKMCAYTNEITIVIDILRWKICRNLIFIVWILHSFEIIDRQTRRRWCPLFYCYFIDFFLLFHVSCCLAGHQLSINEPFFRSTFFFVAIHRWLTNGDNSLCCLCCCCSFLIDIIVQKIVPSLHIFCAFDIFRQTFLFLIFFFDIFFFLFFLPSRRQWKCRNRKPKEGKTKIWPTFGISSGLVLFLSRQ